MASFSKKLCRAVERRKVLYDRSIQSGVKRRDIDSAWDDVADECGESVASVKTRWRNIRKVLLRFMTKASTTPPSRKTRARDYYLYDELQFLLPHLVNHNQDELADSDQEAESNSSHSMHHKESTPTSVRDHTDDSNECLSTISASENGGNTTSSTAAAPTPTHAEKRKRESKEGQSATPMNSSSKSSRSNKVVEQYIITEVLEDEANSAARYRRANHAKTNATRDKVPNKQVENQEELHQEQRATSTTTTTTEDPLNVKVGVGQKNGSSRMLRTRSKSLYLERPPAYDGSTDSDTDDNPPPRKKAVVVVNTEIPAATTTMVTRKKAASKVKPEPAASTSSKSTQKIKIQEKIKDRDDSTEPSSTAVMPVQNPKTVSAVNDSDDNDVGNDNDFEGIDMTLLAAAAEAEAAAAADDACETKGHMTVLCPVVPPSIDAAIQCDYRIDEEDDEFIQRMRKWLQVMTQRQKIIFRRGIYQAYMDVYDDPREFQPQKGGEKFQMSQSGVPAIFTGMTPVELRLVRHLAMAVTGHKITASTSPFSNIECKATTRPQVAGNQSNNRNYNEGKLPTLSNAMATNRTPPEKIYGNNANSGNGSSGILRTTAIALTNHHNVRSGACMPRILRKVVRVGSGSGSNSNSHSNSGATDGSNAASNSQNSLLRNANVVRPRLVTSYNSNSDKQQRVYRILPNGVVQRQSPGPGSGSGNNSSSNNNNSPTSLSTGYGMISNANANSKQSPTSGNTTINHYRQILPKLPTMQSASASASASSSQSPSPSATSMAMTTATKHAAGQTITINGEHKLSGISIRRHVATSAAGAGATSATTTATTTDGRTPMSRRYSVCGSAIADGTPVQTVTRRSVAALPMVNIGDQPKCTTRVRYAHSPSQQQQQQMQQQTVRTAILQPKFAMPSPLAGQQGNGNCGTIMAGPLAGVPLNEPIPVSMNTWHTTQGSSHALHELLQPISGDMDDINLPEEQLVEPNEPEDPVNDGNIDEKQNCIISSDAFENFVIKNEPLDMEEEE